MLDQEPMISPCFQDVHFSVTLYLNHNISRPKSSYRIWMMQQMVAVAAG